MHNLGYTRSAREASHLLQTAETFVRAPLPGMRNATAVIHVSPAAGAAFTQYTAEFEATGALGPAVGQRFLYVLEGAINLDGRTLSTNAFAYLPENCDTPVTSEGPARAVVIEKPYALIDGHPPPAMFVADEATVPAAALNDDPDLQVRTLLPSDASFDFAVNTMTYQPGASLPMVEIHVMEHGLLMLAGGGIYRLGDRWYPVTAGDFIWMAPFCPQWFGALGKSPSKYLIYKDWNR
jgi:(S)-ureidoglycine aminohydrolase